MPIQKNMVIPGCIGKPQHFVNTFIYINHRVRFDATLAFAVFWNPVRTFQNV